MTTTEHTAHFTVCGDGITNIVRKLYCFNENREGAMAVLSHLRGITEEQSIKVCTGDARISDIGDDGTVQYIEEPDSEFKHEYHMYMLSRERRDRKIKEEDEAEWERVEAAADENHISPDTQQWVNEHNPYHEWNRIEALTNKLSRVNNAMCNATTIDELADAPNAWFEEPVIPEPSIETIKVGKWNVPKNLLDRYSQHVVRRIRASIRTGALKVLDPMMVYNMEIERQELHAAICKAVGFDHDEDEPTDDQKEFDNAITDYLDEHAGKLFDGDE